MDSLKEGNYFNRINAVKTIGWFGPAAKEAIPDLISALDDEEETMRREVVIALGNIGPAAQSAVPALTALKDQVLLKLYVDEALKEIIGN